MGLRIFLCAPTCRMEDQPQHDDESFNQDNAGTGAVISTENDAPANLHDGPDGAPRSAPAVALESPSAANDENNGGVSVSVAVHKHLE